MENIETVAKYHYKHGYYVEVDSLEEYGTDRDYWLCKRGEKKKLFMFSAAFKDMEVEERRILAEIEDSIREYENSAETKYA
ncbi:MAG: hypothetical protein LUE14_04370 [Clostridiales bacterium]|nr:hypothetical protein [Clostridiales bacterium]